MSEKRMTIAFGRKKRIDLNIFNNKLYLHLNDVTKSKSVSMQYAEYTQLIKLKNKIDKKAMKLKGFKNAEKNKESDEEETKPKKTKKNQKRKSTSKSSTKPESTSESSSQSNSEDSE